MITADEHLYNLQQIQKLNQHLLNKNISAVSRQMMLDSLRDFHAKRIAYEAQAPACGCGSCE